MSEESTNCSDCKIKDLCPKHIEKCAISGYEADYQTIVKAFSDRLSELEKKYNVLNKNLPVDIKALTLIQKNRKRIESLEAKLGAGGNRLYKYLDGEAVANGLDNSERRNRLQPMPTTDAPFVDGDHIALIDKSVYKKGEPECDECEREAFYVIGLKKLCRECVVRTDACYHEWQWNSKEICDECIKCGKTQFHGEEIKDTPKQKWKAIIGDNEYEFERDASHIFEEGYHPTESDLEGKLIDIYERATSGDIFNFSDLYIALAELIDKPNQEMKTAESISHNNSFIAREVDKIVKEIEHDNKIEKRLKEEFVKEVVDIVKNIEYENKNGTWNEDIKNNTKNKRYWKGYRYGILSILTDYIIPLKEKFSAFLGDLK